MGQATPPGGMIRTLSVSDVPHFRDHLLRLDGETRQNRFAMGASDGFLKRYADTAFAIEADNFGYFEHGVLRAAAELRPVSPREAEAAFTVEIDRRGKGIGSALFAQVIGAARERRLRRLYMSCLSYNSAMQALARKFSAELVFEARDVLAISDRNSVARRPQAEPENEDRLHFATAILTIEKSWFPLRPR